MPTKRILSVLFVGLFSTVGVTYLAEANGGPDHLKCYKIKNELNLKGIVDIDTPQFGLEAGCTIKKAKEFCVPADKTVKEAFDGKEPITPNPLPFPPAAGDSICYMVKCPATQPPPGDQTVTDQFDSRRLSKFKVSKLCVPAYKGFCGDAICTAPENASTCPQDCPDSCGDTFCTGSENASTCPQDCGCAANPAGLCGVTDAQAPGGCYCDELCFSNNDCCADVCATCTTLDGCPS